jgi:hypothetical protein
MSVLAMPLLYLMIFGKAKLIDNNHGSGSSFWHHPIGLFTACLSAAYQRKLIEVTALNCFFNRFGERKM